MPPNAQRYRRLEVGGPACETDKTKSLEKCLFGVANLAIRVPALLGGVLHKPFSTVDVKYLTGDELVCH